MTSLFLSLLNRSITASWLILVVVALRFVLKKAPKSLICGLWLLVAFRLVCPVSLESVISLVPNANPVPEAILLSPAPGTATGEGVAIDIGVPVLNQAVNTAVAGSMTPEALTSVNPLQVWTFLAAALWVMGMAVLLLYGWITCWQVARRVAPSIHIGNGIWICDHIDSPFILGIFRPRIYLPSTLESRDADYVLAHERSHLKRKDHLWKPLGYVLLCIYWFNPVIWVAYILLCRDIELACDEIVIRDYELSEKKAYSTALLNCSLPRHMIAACPLAFGEVGVKERVKNVLNYKKPAFWIVAVAVVLSILAAACFLTDPPEKAEETASAHLSDITADNCSWDTAAVNSLGGISDRYRILVCHDFATHYVSFFDPQIVGNDLIIGVRYDEDKVGAAWFGAGTGNYIYREGYPFSRFSPAGEDGLYTVETELGTVTLCTDAGKTHTSGGISLNVSRETIDWTLPEEILEANYTYFDPQYYGSSLFLGCKGEDHYRLLHFGLGPSGRYEYKDILSLPTATITDGNSQLKAILITDPSVTGITCNTGFWNYIRIPRYPSVVILDKASWGEIDDYHYSERQEIPPVVDFFSGETVSPGSSPLK